MKYRDGGGTYTVKSGDTFNAIAYANGVTPAELVAANPKISADNLSIGQVLTIPNATQVTEVAETPTNADNIYLRQAYAESSFRPKVIKGEIDSPVGALGLVQIMPSTVKEMKKLGLVSKDFDPLDPKQAVVGQAAYMNWIAERPYLNKGEDSVKQAKFLGAYNTGVGNIKSALTKAKAAGVDIYKTLDWVDSKYLPKETVNYINRITGKNDQFNLDFDKAVSDTTNKYILDLYNKKHGGPHDPPKVKQRKGVRENYDYKEWTPSGLQFPTSVSSHLMKAEYVDDKDESTGKPVGWVGFPSLFQDSKPYANDQDNWVQTSEDNGWGPIYEKAKRRGEVYNFGKDKETAIAFGEGSWKDQLPDEGVELTDEEVEEYRAGGYIVEEMHEGGEPGHTHKNPAQWWRDVPGTPSKRTEEEIKLDKDLEESIYPPNAKLIDLTDEQQKKIVYMQNHSSMSQEGLQNAINVFAKNNPKPVEPEIIPYQYPKNTNASKAWDVQNQVFPMAIDGVNDWYTEWYKGRKTNPKFADLAKKRYEAAFFKQTPFVLQSAPDFRKSGHDANLAVTYVPNVGDPANKPWENKIAINNVVFPDSGNNDYYNSLYTDPTTNINHFQSEGVHEKSHWDENNYPQEGTSRHTIADDKVLSEIIPEGFHSNKGISKLWDYPDEDPESYAEVNTNFKSGVNLDSRWGSYISKPTEIRARLNVWRQGNDISPTKDYSIKELQRIINKNVKDAEDSQSYDFNNIMELYHVIKGDPKLLKQLNDSYVKNEETSNVLNDQYAQLGGSIEAELSDEDVERYKAGGYVLEEMHEGGDIPLHNNPHDPPNYEDAMQAYKDSIAAKEAYEEEYKKKEKDYSKLKAKYDKYNKAYLDNKKMWKLIDSIDPASNPYVHIDTFPSFNQGLNAYKLYQNLPSDMKEQLGFPEFGERDITQRFNTSVFPAGGSGSYFDEDAGQPGLIDLRYLHHSDLSFHYPKDDPEYEPNLSHLAYPTMTNWNNNFYPSRTPSNSSVLNLKENFPIASVYDVHSDKFKNITDKDLKVINFYADRNSDLDFYNREILKLLQNSGLDLTGMTTNATQSEQKINRLIKLQEPDKIGFLEYNSPEVLERPSFADYVDPMPVIKPELIKQDATLPELVGVPDDGLSEDYVLDAFNNIAGSVRVPAGTTQNRRRNYRKLKRGKLDGEMYSQGGFIEAELTNEQVEQYKAGGYVLEELVDGGEDDLLTYKNDKAKIDSVADWQSQSDVNITSSYNDQIKARLLTGNYGYNPKSGELVKLSKSKRTKVTDKYALETKKDLNVMKNMTEDEKLDYAQYKRDDKDWELHKKYIENKVPVLIDRADAWRPHFQLTDKYGSTFDTYDKAGQEVFMTPAQKDSYLKGMVSKNAPIAQQQLNNVFGAAAAFTPPGAAILGMYGATKLLVDSGPKLINNPGSLKNWGNAALDALISTPITKGPAKFMRNLYTGKNTTILNQSNLPFIFRYKNHKGNIDIGLGASEYNLTNYKPLVQGTTGSGQWAVATKPLQFIKTLKPASTPGPLTAVSTAAKKPLTLYPSLGGNPFVVPSARYTFPQYMRNDFDIDYTTGARISNSKAITPKNFFNPDPKSTIQGMSQDKGYVFDPESTASNSVQPKNVGTSFKSLLENGAVTKIAKDGVVLTKEALGIIAKESVPHLKIPRIEQELIKRYGSIPEKVSLDELKDIANSTAVPMNIQVSGKKNKVNGEVRYETPAAISGNYGNPTYGYSSIGFNDPVITDDAMGEFHGMNDLEARTYLDDLNKKYVGEDQTFKNEYNTLGQKENETRSLLQNTNTQISEINSQVMLTKDLEVRQALLPKLETLTSESTFLTQQLDNIIKTKKALTAKADVATDKLRMRINAHDYHVTGVTPKFNVNTRTLTFSNKERLPGYGTTSHGTPEGTMGHVYITERNTEPNVLYVTQRQSDASQTKTFSERTLAEKFGKEKFARILARVKADISTHLDKNTEGIVEAASDWRHVVDALKEGRPYEDYKIELENLEKIIGKPVFSDEGLAKTSSATPTASYTKMVDALPDAKAYQKTNQDRMIQETINWASQNGYVEVRFPTAETATNIQAYGGYLMDPKLTSWKEVDGKIMYGVPSDPDAYLNLINYIPEASINRPFASDMTLVNYLDVTKNKATIPTKNLSEADRFNLATMLNKEKTSINKTQVSIIPLYEQLGITRAISKSDKPLWEYVQKTDSNGKPIKGREFKSDFYTEEQVIKFKEVLNGGKRKLDHYKQSKKDNISPYEHENRYMLLPEDKYKLMQEYEDIGKILKKTYPNAQIDKVIQDGNVWWNIKLPEDVLKGKRPIIAYKLGGSVEAELSLKDVQKYIDGGYVLEEIN